MIQTNTFWTFPRKTCACENSGLSRGCVQVAVSPDILKQFPWLARRPWHQSMACLRVREGQYVNDTHVLHQECCWPPSRLVGQKLIILLSEADPKSREFHPKCIIFFLLHSLEQYLSCFMYHKPLRNIEQNIIFYYARKQRQMINYWLWVDFYDKCFLQDLTNICELLASKNFGWAIETTLAYGINSLKWVCKSS